MENSSIPLWSNNLELWLYDIIFKLIAIIIIFIIAKLLIFILNKIVKKQIARRKQKSPNSVIARKSETILVAYKSAIKYLIYFVALISILAVLGLTATLSSILTAAGIGGLVIGFGAQKLVGDFFSGFFMLFEDQFSVGDYIEVADGIKGTVEGLSIRTTVIRMAGGELVTIPNGSIGKMINYTRGNINVFLDVMISHGQDIGLAIASIHSSVENYAKDNAHIISKYDVLGVVEIENPGIKIRTLICVKPMFQWAVTRDLNKIILESFKNDGIETGYAQNINYNLNSEEISFDKDIPIL